MAVRSRCEQVDLPPSVCMISVLLRDRYSTLPVRSPDKPLSQVLTNYLHQRQRYLVVLQPPTGSLVGPHSVSHAIESSTIK